LKGAGGRGKDDLIPLPLTPNPLLPSPYIVRR
jgi:hypothetical protein